MAYDEDLANRIRELVGGQPGVTEKKMFGGLAFLIDTNMAVAASGQGGVMVRVDPLESDKLVVSRPRRQCSSVGLPSTRPIATAGFESGVTTLVWPRTASIRPSGIA